MKLDLARIDRLEATAERTAQGGSRVLSDRQLLDLLSDHRWAVAQLASPRAPVALRSRLNAAVLKTHGVLHVAPRRVMPAVEASLRSVGPAIGLSAGVFIGAALLAFSTILAEPLIALTLVPRSLLQQIDPSHWGSRGSGSADAGMTLFYWSNNLRTAFAALGLGVLGGYPALAVVATNGALLGAVGAAALTRGAAFRLLGWIAPHCVPELAGVILAGAIGWQLGHAWLVPGWRTRRAAVAEAGRVLTPMVLTAALLIIAAAPLEGFVAPLDLPPAGDATLATSWVVLLAALAAHVLTGRGDSA